MSVIALVLSIVFTAIGQVSYKLFFLKSSKVYLFASIIFFCFAPIMSYLVLLELALTTVYMSTGLTYVLVLLAAKFLLGESISRRKNHSIVLIIGGVFIFNV